MSEQKEAILKLADWCEKYGNCLDAQIILISDIVSDDPLGVNTGRVSSIQGLRDIAEDF